MEITLLDLSRQADAAKERVSRAYRDAVVSPVNKAEWKRLGTRGLLAEVRAIRADLFVIAVDDLETAQDLMLFEALGVMTAAHRVAILEVSNGNFIVLGRARFVFVTVPRMLVGALASLLFVGVFGILVGLAGLLLGFRTTQIRSGYQRGAHPARVAYLKSDLSLNIKAGGSIAHTTGVIGGFLSNGLETRVLSNEDAPWLRLPGFDIRVLRRTRRFSFWRESERMVNGLFLAWQALRELEGWKPDLIYQRKCQLDLSGVVLSWVLRVPLVIEGNDCAAAGLYWERSRFRGLSAAVERLQFRAATEAVCISHPLLEVFRSHGLDTARTHVIFNGVTVERFNTPEQNERASILRAEYGYRPETVVFGFVGTFGQWHGIPTLTQGIIRLLGSRGDVAFLLIGDGELRESCAKEVREAGYEQQVRFTGLVPAGDVPALLAACDVLVSPHGKSRDGTRFIGSPTKLFEYMAAQRAIVASNLDQIGEILRDSSNALLFEPDDSDGFVLAMGRLAESASLRSSLAAQARRDVAENYTWHANVRQVLFHLAAGSGAG